MKLVSFPDITKTIFDPVAIVKALSGDLGGFAGVQGEPFAEAGAGFGNLGAAQGRGEKPSSLDEILPDNPYWFDPAKVYDPTDYFDVQGILDDMVKGLWS